MSRRPFLIGLSAASVAFATTVAVSEVFDPAAITVFPDHDRIGKRYSLSRAVSDGRALFGTKFNALDGGGRPFATGDSKPTPRLASGPAFHRVSGPDANSCFGCHNQPRFGGNGDISANVFFGAQFADPLVDSVRGDRSNSKFEPTTYATHCNSGLV